MGKMKRNGTFACAARGIFYTIKTQRNMRIHCVVALAALGLSWFFKITAAELLWIILAIFMMFIAEIFNTALEVVIDLVCPQYHPMAGIAKDVAAGAVLVAALHAVVVGFFVFGRYVFWQLSMVIKGF